MSAAYPLKLLIRKFTNPSKNPIMPQQKIAMLRDAVSAAAICKKPPSFLSKYSRSEFYKVVYAAVKKAGLYKEDNHTYFCDKLQLPRVVPKADLLYHIQLLATVDATLDIAEVDRGLKCINSVINIGIKGQDKIAAFIGEIWSRVEGVLKSLCEEKGQME